MNIASPTDRGHLRYRPLVIFIALLLFDLVAIGIDKEHWRFFSKPLLMPALLLYFLLSVKINTISRWVIGALVFSWLGDVLLMLQGDNDSFFLYGLSAFLLAHICYIICFHKIRVKEGIQSRWWLLLIVVAYYTGLIVLLSPYLGDMKLAVRIYGIVISFMFLLALHLFFMSDKKTGQLVAAGAILFVISDSILAINKFYQPFSTAGLLVMVTYGLAQLLIVCGVIRYARQ